MDQANLTCKTYHTKTGKHIRLWHGDCMDLMDGKPENHWDLAIVDPPYGIGANKEKEHNGWKSYGIKEWDNSRPGKIYFLDITRKSYNQIIWGANYFTEYLSSSMGWVVWDKGQRNFSLSDGELAYTSFDKALKIFSYSRGLANSQLRIHATQKPIRLYRWLLQNYAEPDDTILDTHGGSMSLAIACYIEDHELDIIELDEDYYKKAVQRFENHISQKTLF